MLSLTSLGPRFLIFSEKENSVWFSVPGGGCRALCFRVLECQGLNVPGWMMDRRKSSLVGRRHSRMLSTRPKVFGGEESALTVPVWWQQLYIWKCARTVCVCISG